jgi:hypothetical protein
VNKPDFCVLSSNLLSIFSYHVRDFSQWLCHLFDLYEFAVILRNSTPPLKFIKLMKHSDRISIIKVK